MPDDLDELSRWARRAAEQMPAAVASGVLLAAEHAAGALREKVLRTFDTRTGTLARSWKASFLGDVEGNVAAIAASDLVYARTLDKGATITPKTRKRLAIPQFRNPIGKWPRDHAKGELHRRGSALFDKSGVMQYALAKSVTIRGREYVAETQAEIADELAEILGDNVETIALGPGET